MTEPRHIKVSAASSAARKAVLEQLSLAHDAWAERQQVYALAGREMEVEGAGRYASWVLRAYVAELRDPEPLR